MQRLQRVLIDLGLNSVQGWGRAEWGRPGRDCRGDCEMALLTAFFTPVARAPEQALLQWSANKVLPRSTACVTVVVKARVGSWITHKVHGKERKVKLLSQVSPDILYVEYALVDAEHGGTSMVREEVMAVDHHITHHLRYETPDDCRGEGLTPHAALRREASRARGNHRLRHAGELRGGARGQFCLVRVQKYIEQANWTLPPFFGWESTFRRPRSGRSDFLGGF